MSDKSGNSAPTAQNTSDGSKPDLDPELEKQLREAAEAEDRLVQDMKDKCRSEFDKRSSLLTDQFNLSFSNQMSHMGDRFTSHSHDNVTTRQTDVLRTNKVIRDVSRDLGADWKPVFQRLMKDVDEQKVKVEMARIERQKPFMQPFKALNTWKDFMGDKFEIRLLTEALVSVDRRDLAEKVFEILDNNELDSLYAMDAVGKGIAGGAAPRRAPPKPQEEGDATVNGSGEAKVEQKPGKPIIAEDPVADRVLLRIAKAIDKDWVPLAEALALTEEELQETKDSGQDTYHGGFKAMYTWRDNQVELGKSNQEMAHALREALTKTGKTDLAASIVVS